jgi:hypothetical protein
MKKNVPSTDPNGDAKRQILEKAEHLMIVIIENSEFLFIGLFFRMLINISMKQNVLMII